MWFPYGAGRWTWMHNGGADLSGDDPRDVDDRAGAAAPPSAGPGDDTPVSAWEAVSIVLGLAVLGGAMAAVVVTVFVAVLGWLVVTAGDERVAEPPPGSPPQAW